TVLTQTLGSVSSSRTRGEQRTMHLRSSSSKRLEESMASFRCCLTKSPARRRTLFAPEHCEPRGFPNRTKSRVVLELYGPSVWFFESRYQLVSAFRDAIAAHGELLKRQVLHRDISVNNILLADANNTHSGRGVLIDLDLAVWAERGVSSTIPDKNKGTLMYQSICVLRSSEEDVHPSPPLDYLDDLESFFYVFCHLIFAFVRPGEPAPVEHPLL
ncbi:hypothetical protein DFP72DRAFT_921168, partial [Ephemerocybe angulata]